jgi:hypothetical protein
MRQPLETVRSRMASASSLRPGASEKGSTITQGEKLKCVVMHSVTRRRVRRQPRPFQVRIATEPQCRAVFLIELTRGQSIPRCRSSPAITATTRVIAN